MCVYEFKIKKRVKGDIYKRESEREREKERERGKNRI